VIPAILLAINYTANFPHPIKMLITSGDTINGIKLAGVICKGQMFQINVVLMHITNSHFLEDQCDIFRICLREVRFCSIYSILVL
jgi:hypothetical protein